MFEVDVRADVRSPAVKVLTRGARPPVPKDCPARFQALMTACWEQEPSHRPPFSFIVTNLAEQLAEQKKRPADFRPA